MTRSSQEKKKFHRVQAEERRRRDQLTIISGLRIKMGRHSTTVYVQDPTGWYFAQSVQFENTKIRGICTTWRFIRRILCEILTPGTREVNQEPFLRVGRDCGVDGGKGSCYQWTKGPETVRRPTQFQVRNPRSSKKTRPQCRHTFRANRITRSKCVEDKKYPRAKVTMVLSSTTVQILCERCLHTIVWRMLASSRLSTSQNRNALDMCFFQHHKVVVQPSKSQWKTLLFTQKRESDDKDAVVIVEAEKPDAKKFWDQFGKVGSFSPCHVRSPRFVTRVFGTRRTIVWKDTSQTSTSSFSLCFEIWGPVPWRDWQTRAMCPTRFPFVASTRVGGRFLTRKWISRSSSSLGKVCEDHVCIYHGKAVKITRARELIVIYPTMYHFLFMVYQWVLHKLHTSTLFHHNFH